MRRLIPLVILVVLAAGWGISLAVSVNAVERARSLTWPLQLGRLRDVPARFPRRNASAAALALGPLEARLGIRLDRQDKRPATAEERAFSLVKNPLSDYLALQLTRPNDFRDPAPVGVSTFLLDHRQDIDALRAHLLANGAAIEWQTDVARLEYAPLPNLLAHMSVERLLVADALQLSRSAEAWEDLHAAWILTRPLFRRPETISQLIAIATTRYILGGSRKLSGPAPAWLAEIRAVDATRSMIAADQADAWIAVQSLPYLDTSSRVTRVVIVLLRPMLNAFAADLATRECEIATHLVAVRGCAFDGVDYDRRTKAAIRDPSTYARKVLPPWGSSWQRVLRIRVESELTMKTLELKARGWPPSAPDLLSSECTDGVWRYADGSLQFSRELPPITGAFTPLRYSRDATPSRTTP
jgi:hypothetical protein